MNKSAKNCAYGMCLVGLTFTIALTTACRNRSAATNQNELREFQVSSTTSILCTEERNSTKENPLWSLTIEFNPTGTAASLNFAQAPRKPLILRTNFEYSSTDKPSPQDDYIFPTGRNESLTYSTDPKAGTGSATWNRTGEPIQFACSTKSTPGAEQTGETNSQTNQKPNQLTCSELGASPPWRLNIKISRNESTDQSDGPLDAEITWQKQGVAPSIRQAKILPPDYESSKLESPTSKGQIEEDFLKRWPKLDLVVSRTEQIHIEQDSQKTAATWQRSSTSMDFDCTPAH